MRQAGGQAPEGKGLAGPGLAQDHQARGGAQGLQGVVEGLAPRRSAGLGGGDLGVLGLGPGCAAGLAPDAAALQPQGHRDQGLGQDPAQALKGASLPGQRGVEPFHLGQLALDQQALQVGGLGPAPGGGPQSEQFPAAALQAGPGVRARQIQGRLVDNLEGQLGPRLGEDRDDGLAALQGEGQLPLDPRAVLGRPADQADQDPGGLDGGGDLRGPGAVGLDAQVPPTGDAALLKPTLDTPGPVVPGTAVAGVADEDMGYGRRLAVGVGGVHSGRSRSGWGLYPS